MERDVGIHEVAANIFPIHPLPKWNIHRTLSNGKYDNHDNQFFILSL